GAKVVNLSFAGPRDALLSRALRAASLRGLVLVAAVGNAGPKAKPLFPAAHPDVIGVTAVDAQDRIYKAAGAGAHVAVAAPGVDILAPAVDGAYQQPSGTSFAAAHVSGIAALLLQIDPDLTPEDVRRVLTETAQDLGPKGRDDTFGAGRVSALAALQAVVKSREIRAATKAELTD